MRRLLLRVAVVSAVASCVPTEPEKDPRGGVSVTFAPSEATAGAPFQTNDGWTVVIEKTALRANAFAQSQSLSNYGGGGASFPRLVDPRYLCELRVTQLSPGPVSISVQLHTFDPRWSYEDNDVEACAVDELTRRRFRTYADDEEVTPETLEDQKNTYMVINGPSVYVKGYGTKNGRTIRFDFGLGVQSTFQNYGTYDENGTYKPPAGNPYNTVNVVANEGAPIRFEVHFETIFANGLDPLAAADANGDGVASPEELRAVKLSCDTTTPPSGSSSGFSSSSGYSSSGYSSSGYDYGDDGYFDENGQFVRSCPTLMTQLRNQAAGVVSATAMPR